MEEMTREEKLKNLEIFLDALINEWDVKDMETMAHEIMKFQDGGYDLSDYEENA